MGDTKRPWCRLGQRQRATDLSEDELKAMLTVYLGMDPERADDFTAYAAETRKRKTIGDEDASTKRNKCEATLELKDLVDGNDDNRGRRIVIPNPDTDKPAQLRLRQT